MVCPKRRILFFAFGFVYLSTASASPFLTGSPTPTAYEQIDLFLSTDYNKTSEGTGVQFPVFEIDWGFAPSWSTSLVIPISGDMPNNDVSSFGTGDIQLGLTKQFTQESEKIPEISISPVLILPTGNAQRGLGNGDNEIQIPLWLQKSWDRWMLYGGGGYIVNTASQTYNAIYGGVAIQHNMTENFMLGAEIYAEGAESAEETSTTVLNFGGSYALNKNIILLASAGHSIAGSSQTIAYLGVNWNINL